MTATIEDNNGEPILNATYVKATPFSYGSGHVQPNWAMDPGLIYDISTVEYLNFLCALGYNQTEISFFSDDAYACPKTVLSLTNLNYPSIAIPNLSRRITVTRKVKNIGSPGTYIVSVNNPEGISVYIKPRRLRFRKTGEEKSFRVILKVKKPSKVPKDYVFGELVWSDENGHQVRSPMVVKVI